MKSSLDLSLILPCYNEAPIFRDSVREIVATLRLSRLTFEIIFVDDKSSDRTPRLIKDACRPFKAQGKRGNDKNRCRALFHPVNEGRGKTVADGILAAKGTVAGYIDIDLEVSPVYVSTMAAMILSGKADMVIGKRIYRSSVSSTVRELLSVGYQWLAHQLIDTGKLDTESGYKFFHRKKILPVLSDVRHPHWFWDTEVVVLARRKKLRITEVPVLFLRRFDKKSSVRLFRDILDYLVNLWTFRKRLQHTS